MKKINTGAFPCFTRFNEPMARHTTFAVGGPADVFVRPHRGIFPLYVSRLLRFSRAEGIPVFILGGGANIVVSDRGIRGIVLDTGLWRGARLCAAARSDGTAGSGDSAEQTLEVLSGTALDPLINSLAARGLGGLEVFAGMPGTAGGALWMNARCDDISISDLLIETKILDENSRHLEIPFAGADFSYKKSPFQSRSCLILSARFKLSCREAGEIKAEAAGRREKRKESGQYRFPSAGSVFKNNRTWEKPSGKIIDEAGLKGLSYGGAMVAPWHGNFIVNTGSATARDIKALAENVSRAVKERFGLELESEVLYVGEW